MPEREILRDAIVRVIVENQGVEAELNRISTLVGQAAQKSERSFGETRNASRSLTRELGDLRESYRAGFITADQYEQKLNGITAGIAKQRASVGGSVAELGKLARAQNVAATATQKLAREQSGVDQTIARLRNRSLALRQEYESGIITQRELVDQAERLKRESLELARAFDRSTTEYKQFLDVAGRSDRTIATAEGRLTKLGFSANAAVGVTNSLENQLARLGPAGQLAAGGVNTFAGGLATAGAGTIALAAGGAAAAAGLIQLARIGTTANASLQRSANVLELSGASADLLGESLTNAGRAAGRAGRQFSRAELGETVADLVKAGFDAEESLTLLTPAIQIAAAEQRDLTETSALLGTNLRQFGRDASSAAEFADKLAEAGFAARSEVFDLSQGLSVVGPIANAAGISLDYVLASLVALDNKGLDPAQEGATGLRSVINALLSPTAQAADVLAQLGISLETAEGRARPVREVLDDLREAIRGNAEAANIAAEVFDTRAVTAFVNLTDEVEVLEEALQNSEGAAERFAETMTDDLASATDRFRAQAEDLGQALTKNTTGAFAGLVDVGTRLLGVLEDLANFGSNTTINVPVRIGGLDLTDIIGLPQEDWDRIAGLFGIGQDFAPAPQPGLNLNELRSEQVRLTGRLEDLRSAPAQGGATQVEISIAERDLAIIENLIFELLNGGATAAAAGLPSAPGARRAGAPAVAPAVPPELTDLVAQARPLVEAANTARAGLDPQAIVNAEGALAAFADRGERFAQAVELAETIVRNANRETTSSRSGRTTRPDPTPASVFAEFVADAEAGNRLQAARGGGLGAQEQNLEQKIKDAEQLLGQLTGQFGLEAGNEFVDAALANIDEFTRQLNLLQSAAADREAARERQRAATEARFATPEQQQAAADRGLGPVRSVVLEGVTVEVGSTAFGSTTRPSAAADFAIANRPFEQDGRIVSQAGLAQEAIGQRIVQGFFGQLGTDLRQVIDIAADGLTDLQDRVNREAAEGEAAFQQRRARAAAAGEARFGGEGGDAFTRQALLGGLPGGGAGLTPAEVVGGLRAQGVTDELINEVFAGLARLVDAQATAATNRALAARDAQTARNADARFGSDELRQSFTRQALLRTTPGALGAADEEFAARLRALGADLDTIDAGRARALLDALEAAGISTAIIDAAFGDLTARVQEAERSFLELTRAERDRIAENRFGTDEQLDALTRQALLQGLPNAGAGLSPEGIAAGLTAQGVPQELIDQIFGAELEAADLQRQAALDFAQTVLGSADQLVNALADGFQAEDLGAVGGAVGGIASGLGGLLGALGVAGTGFLGPLGSLIGPLFGLFGSIFGGRPEPEKVELGGLGGRAVSEAASQITLPVGRASTGPAVSGVILDAGLRYESSSIRFESAVGRFETSVDRTNRRPSSADTQ